MCVVQLVQVSSLPKSEQLLFFFSSSLLYSCCLCDFANLDVYRSTYCSSTYLPCHGHRNSGVMPTAQIPVKQHVRHLHQIAAAREIHQQRRPTTNLSYRAHTRNRGRCPRRAQPPLPLSHLGSKNASLHHRKAFKQHYSRSTIDKTGRT